MRTIRAILRYRAIGIRCFGLLAVAAAVVLVAASVAPSLVEGAGQHARCNPAGHVVTANATAVVWWRGSADSHTSFVCAWRTGKPHSLGDYDIGVFGSYAFRLAGRYLAYDDLTCGM